MMVMFFGGCGFGSPMAGVEIMSYPTAKVYLDGKEAGMTPYKNTALIPKEVEIKLVVNEMEWVKKIKLKNGTTTVVDYGFGKTEKESGGYVLSMEKTGDKKKAGLMVEVVPNKSAIKVEGETKGNSPIKLDDIIEGDRQISISFPTYKSINVYTKAINGYQLIIEAKLAEEVTEREPDPMVTTTPTIKEKTVMIKETETGWLRVRKEANNGSEELGKVKPMEKFKLIEEISGWYKIELGDKRQGWVSAKYAEKSE